MAGQAGVPTRVAFSGDGAWIAGLVPDSKGCAYFAAAPVPQSAAVGADDVVLEKAVSADALQAAVVSTTLSLEEQLKRERTRNLITGVSVFEWSPAGASVLLPFGGDLFLAHPPANATETPQWTTTRVFDHTTTGHGGAAMEHQWSQDGQWVLFVQDGEVMATSATPRCATADCQHADGSTGGSWGVVNGHITVRLTQGAWESRDTDSPFKQGEADYLGQESFSRFKGYWLAPDASWLAFQRTVDSHVPDFTIRHQHEDDPYAQEVHKYPFPGGENPHVTLHLMPLAALPAGQVANAAAAGATAAALAATASLPCAQAVSLYDHHDWYLSRAAWDHAGGLLVITANRAQNQRHCVRVQAPTSPEAEVLPPTLLIHEAATHWVDTCTDLWRPVAPASPGAPARLLWGSERSGHSHLYLYTYDAEAGGAAVPHLQGGACPPLAEAQGGKHSVWVVPGGSASLQCAVTGGDFSITSVDAVGAASGLLHITANACSPLERSPYIVPLDGSAVAAPSPAPAAPAFADWFVPELCQWGADVTSWGKGMAAARQVPLAGVHAARCSPVTVSFQGQEGRWTVYERSSMASQPTLSLYFAPTASPHASVRVGGVRGSPPSATAPPAPSLVPAPRLFAVLAEDGATTLLGAVWLPKAPAGSPPPAVVSVYGGPHVQYVQMNWRYMGGDPTIARLLSEGYAVVRVDNRGSFGRGVAFESPIHRSMGIPEVADQATAVQWLQEHGIIASGGVGITGWSYGGYMSLMATAQRPDVFTAAVAGAPVTHWRLYDSGYTERFMGVPSPMPATTTATAAAGEAGVDAYTHSSVEAHMESWLAAASPPAVLIVHGMLDENVHFRHTARLTTKLLRRGIAFDTLVFPDERHAVRQSRALLVKRSGDFMAAHLK